MNQDLTGPWVKPTCEPEIVEHDIDLNQVLISMFDEQMTLMLINNYVLQVQEYYDSFPKHFPSSNIVKERADRAFAILKKIVDYESNGMAVRKFIITQEDND